MNKILFIILGLTIILSSCMKYQHTASFEGFVKQGTTGMNGVIVQIFDQSGNNELFKTTTFARNSGLMTAAGYYFGTLIWEENVFYPLPPLEKYKYVVVRASGTQINATLDEDVVTVIPDIVLP